MTLAAQRGADGDEVLFTVADTGRGIAPEEQDRVFGSFVRGAGETDDDGHGGDAGDGGDVRHSGAGLGLSLVKSFVELHGGHVEVISVLGEGTTVIVHLPAGGNG